MKYYFLNFDINNGLSINTFRNANAVSCVHNDIADFLQDVQKGVNSVVGFDHDYVVDKLEDCYYWQGSDISNDLLEQVYRLVKQHKESL